jgi:hypothetical protein
VITLESTSEGKGGFFYNTCVTAERRRKKGSLLTDLDYQFHFYPWYFHPSSKLSPVDNDLITSPEWELYFRTACEGIKLSPEQKMWYIKKRHELRDINRMYREYPSNSEEAFQSALKGAYFYEELRALYEEGRLI